MRLTCGHSVDTMLRLNWVPLHTEGARTMRRSTLVVAVVLVVAAVAVIVVTLGGRHDPVRIGAMMPLTGDNAVYGKALEQGMRVALEEINARGGVSGDVLEILFEVTQA